MEISVDSLRGAWDRTRGRAEAVVPGAALEAFRAVRDNDVFVFAGSLAFYALVSAAPLAVVSFWIVGSVVGTGRIDAVVDAIVEAAPAGERMKPVLDNLLRTGTAVGIGAVFAAAWPATSYGAGVGRAFARMTGLDNGPLPGLRGRAKALILVPLLPLLLFGALGVGYLAPGLFSGTLATIGGWALGITVAVLVTAGFLAAIFMVFGPDRLSRRAAGLAALGGALAAAVVSMAFTVYAAHGANWQTRAAGSTVGMVVLFAVWLYLVNAIVVVAYTAARVLDDKLLSGQPSRSGGR